MGCRAGGGKDRQGMIGRGLWLCLRYASCCGQKVAHMESSKIMTLLLLLPKLSVLLAVFRAFAISEVVLGCVEFRSQHAEGCTHIFRIVRPACPEPPRG